MTEFHENEFLKSEQKRKPLIYELQSQHAALL